MTRSYDGRYRITEEEKVALVAAAEKSGMSESSLIRMFVNQGLAKHNPEQDDLAKQLSAMQAQIESLKDSVQSLMAISENSHLLAASSVGLLSALNLPQITGESENDVADLIVDNMRFALTMGRRLIKMRNNSSNANKG